MKMISNIFLFGFFTLAGLSHAFAADVVLEVVKQKKLGELSISFSPPHNLCWPSQENRKNSTSYLKGQDFIFSLPNEGRFFLEFRSDSSTIVYQFSVKEKKPFFVGGYFFNEKKIAIKRIGILKQINAPVFELKQNGPTQRLDLQSHSKLSEQNYENLLCAASLRSFKSKFLDFTLKSVPEDASIWVDGKKLPFNTNQKVRAPLKGKSLIVILEKEGFVKSVREIKKNGNYEIILSEIPD